MSDETCHLLAVHGMPVVVVQALDDTALSPMDRLTMWHLRVRLDLLEYREVYVESLARDMRIQPASAGRCLRALVDAGYLDQHIKRRPRAYRFPWSRRSSIARAA